MFLFSVSVLVYLLLLLVSLVAMLYDCGSSWRFPGHLLHIFSVVCVSLLLSKVIPFRIYLCLILLYHCRFLITEIGSMDVKH